MQHTFEEIAKSCSADIARYLARQVRDASVVEDLLQETLIRIARGLTTFEGRSSVKTWIFTIATRVVLDHFRKSAGLPATTELSEAEALPDGCRQPDEQAAIAQMNDCVHQVVESLPEGYRQAIVLHDFGGLSARETAEACGCSEANAKVRIHCGRAQLKTALERQCEFYHDGDSVLRCCRKD